MLSMEIDENDVDEAEEVESLISKPSSLKYRGSKARAAEERSRRKIAAKPDGDSSTFNFLLFTVVNVTIIFFIVKFIGEEYFSSDEETTEMVGDLLYKCPHEFTKSKNDLSGNFDGYHDHNTKHLENMQKFRDMPFGGRDETYSEAKKIMTEFKAQAFGDNLRNGDSIYESACGEGLNLLMTLEILKEERDIDNLVVYGNDYLFDSVAVANEFFDLNSFSWYEKGMICQGDSSNLHSVPSSSFDLVYTGYIDPVIDPFNLAGDNSTWDVHYDTSVYLCNSKYWADKKLAQLEQVKQEDWFAAWVSELVRIVKPGKMVIVETVSHPLCDANLDWGGVSKEWWNGAISKYGWDVDANSIIVTDHPVDSTYNILMQRNP